MKLTSSRIRRKKCDEQRPYCQICISTGRKCDGYASHRGSSDSRPNSFIIGSAKQNQLTSTQSSRRKLNGRLVPDPMSRVPMLVIMCQKYIDYFRLYTIPKFSSYYDSTIWNVLLAHTCILDSDLRSAAAALGASHLEQEACYRIQVPLDTTSEHISQLYIQAISDSRRILRSLSPDYAVGIGFVLSYLLAGVEVLRGTYKNATMHLANGLRIAFSRGCSDIYHKSTLAPGFSLITEGCELLNRLKESLSNIFDLKSRLDSHLKTDFGFPVMQEAFQEILEIEHVIFDGSSEPISGHIQRLLIRLEACGTRVAQVASDLSEKYLYIARLLRIYKESTYLMLLVKAKYGIPESKQYLTGDIQHFQLLSEAYFSKFVMLEEQLKKDKAFVTHLCPAQSKRIAMKNNLLKDNLSDLNLPDHTSASPNVVEHLILLEEDAIRESGLVPAEAVCMDITTALEKGTVSVRYCIKDSDGCFVWVQKKAEIWKPTFFQDESRF